MSQARGLAKPPSAQLIESAGVGCTRPSMAAATTPVRPTTGAGTGSVMIARITATNHAKEDQAAALNPSGVGISAMPKPTASGGMARVSVRRVGMAGGAAAGGPALDGGTLVRP